MKEYIGVKRVKGKRMTRQEYNDYRGWDLPSDENGADEGYLIEYLDSPNGNHPKHEGYISWSPEKQFDDAHREVTGIPFGYAIEAAKRGNKIARTGWNGKNMFVVVMPALNLPPHSSQEPGAKVNDRTAKFIGEDAPLNCVPYFAMYAANGDWVPGWLASQTDMLSEDWCIFD